MPSIVRAWGSSEAARRAVPFSSAAKTLAVALPSLGRGWAGPALVGASSLRHVGLQRGVAGSSAQGCSLQHTQGCSLQPLPARESFELSKLYRTAAVDIRVPEHALERSIRHEDAALPEGRLELGQGDAARSVRVEGHECPTQLGTHLPHMAAVHRVAGLVAWACRLGTAGCRLDA